MTAPARATTARAIPSWAVAVTLAGAVLAVALVKYGIGSFPQWVTLYDIGVHWTDPRAGAGLDSTNDYLLGNSLAAVLAGMVGLLRSREAYGLVMLCLTMVALVWPFLMPQVRQSPERARLLFLVLFAGPVVAIVMVWVGGYDPATVIAASLIGLGRSRWTIATGWVLAAANHWSMAVVALVAWAVVLWFARREDPPGERIRLIATGTVAVVAGTVLVHGVMAAWGGSTSRAEGTDLSYYDTEFVGRLMSNLPWIVLSVLGLGWVLLILLARRRVPGATALVIAVLVASVVIQARALDATRDTALPLLPAVLLVIGVGAPAAERWLRGWRWWLAAAVVVAVPTVLVFGWQVSWVGWGLPA